MISIIYFLVQIKYAHYIKSCGEKKRQYLTEFQELFLLKYIENINRKAIDKLVGHHVDESIVNFIKLIGADTFASHLLLLPAIFERR